MNWRASHASELLRTAERSRQHSHATRLELLRRAALLADAEGDTHTAAAARQAIVQGHLETDCVVDLLAAFTWLLHHSTPDAYQLLWTYKWVVGIMAELLAIRAEIVEQAIDDLERRYTLAGLSTAAAVQLRFEVGLVMKRREQLPELFEAWQRNESGAGSDCPACRRDKRVQYFAAIGDDERVVTESQPLLDGTLRCTEIPRLSYPQTLLALLRTRGVAEADEACRRGLALLGDSERVSGNIGVYLAYLGVRGRIGEGGAILTTWLRRVLLTRVDLARYDFYRGAASLFRAAEARRTGVLHLTLPPAWEAYEPDGLYEVGRLRAWFEHQTEDLARRFDERHGNSGCRDQLQRDHELLAQFPESC